MNKYMIIASIAIYDILIVLTGTALGYAPNVDIFTGANPIAPTLLDFVNQVFSALGFFFNIVFLSIPGIPVLVTFFIFYPVNIIGFFVLLNLIRGTD